MGNMTEVVNWLDLVFAFVLLWAVRSSWQAGLIQETFTLLGLGAGIFAAGRLYTFVARWLFGPEPRDIATAVAFLATLGSVWFAVSFLGRLVRETVYWIKLGWLDKAGGLVFGIAKGVIVIEIFLVVLARFPMYQVEELIAGSLIGNWVARYVTVVITLLPPEFRRLTTILR